MARLIVEGGWRRRLPVLVGLLLLLVVVPVVLGDVQAPAAAEVCPPSPASVSVSIPPASSSAGPTDLAPERIVACVGSRSITYATFEHWAGVAAKAEHPAATNPAEDGDVLNEVMGFLISSDWVIGEAQALKIHVSAAEVRHTFDRIRSEQFHKRQEFRRFLKRSGQTVADLLLRVEVNLTSQRINKHVLAAHHGQRSQLRALRRFVQQFKRKWQVQTYCAPEYATADCGHVQAIL